MAMMIASRWRGSPRSWRATSWPSMPGKTMSSSTNRGRKSPAISRAWRPSWATRMSWPASWSSRAKPRAASTLSSTTRMREPAGGAAGLDPAAGSALGAGASRPAGIRMVNSLPSPGPSLRTEAVPPCSSASPRTSVSPRPWPPSDWPPDAAKSKARGSIAGGMPLPLSRTRKTTASCSRTTEIPMRPPGSVDRAAWRSRPTRICSSRAGSASSASGPGDVERVSW